MLEALIGKLSNPHLVFPYLYEPVSQQLIILTMFIWNRSRRCGITRRYYIF